MAGLGAARLELAQRRDLRKALLEAEGAATLERDGKAYSIIPGMICSVDIKTGRKTILNYLLKPINKARQEAMSER